MSIPGGLTGHCQRRLERHGTQSRTVLSRTVCNAAPARQSLPPEGRHEEAFP